MTVMARKLRVEYPGAIYHVMNRGDRREPIFKDDQDRQCFMDTLGEACRKTQWEIHAWCLMPNHFHLVIETPRANLVAGMKWLLATYTSRFNRRHKLSGHLFGGRYKSLIVNGSPFKAGVNGKNVFGPVFSSRRSGASLSLGFKDLDPSLLFHRSISDASPEAIRSVTHLVRPRLSRDFARSQSTCIIAYPQQLVT